MIQAKDSVTEHLVSIVAGLAFAYMIHNGVSLLHKRAFAPTGIERCIVQHSYQGGRLEIIEQALNIGSSYEFNVYGPQGNVVLRASTYERPRVTTIGPLQDSAPSGAGKPAPTPRTCN